MIIELAAVLMLAQATDPSPSAKGNTPPVRVGQGSRINPPQKVKNVEPKYPENALRAGLSGKVVLECTIGVDGKVKGIRVVEGYRSLAAAATTAVRQWEFTPTLMDGKPMPVIMTVTSRFAYEGPLQLKHVIQATKDADPEIRTAAVQWLGGYRPVEDKQRKAIERLLSDSEPAVRAAATAALGALDRPATPATDQSASLDEALRADVEALLEAMNFSEIAQRAALIASQQFLNELRKSQPNVPDRAVAVLMDVMKVEFANAFAGPDSMVPQLVSIYAKHFTREEVHALAAFYGSDVGKKLLAETPAMLQEIMTVVGQRQPQINRAIESALRAEGLIK